MNVLPAIRSQKWLAPVCRSFILRACVLFLLQLGAASAFSEEIVWLSWDSPDPSQGIIAYQVYWGTSTNYTDSDTSYYSNGDLISGLVFGQTYYFAVAAVNTNGTVSALSPPLVYTVPIPPPVVIQYYVDKDYNGNPTILEMNAAWTQPSDWVLNYSYDMQTWYPWQGGHGVAGAGNPTFDWGGQVFFNFVLY